MNFLKKTFSLAKPKSSVEEVLPHKQQSILSIQTLHNYHNKNAPKETEIKQYNDYCLTPDHSYLGTTTGRHILK